jgi:hypothetical protein
MLPYGASVSNEESDPTRLAHSPIEARLMRNRFLTFTFERESRWVVVLYVLIPLLAILLFLVLPGLWHRWFH